MSSHSYFFITFSHFYLYLLKYVLIRNYNSEMNRLADMAQTIRCNKLQVCFYDLLYSQLFSVAATTSFQSYNLFKQRPNCDSTYTLYYGARKHISFPRLASKIQMISQQCRRMLLKQKQSLHLYFTQPWSEAMPFALSQYRTRMLHSLLTARLQLRRFTWN